MKIIAFSSGEKKLFDVTKLFSMPAFLILEDPDVYKSAAVEYGVVVWKNGELDIAPEYLYENSYTYNEMLLV